MHPPARVFRLIQREKNRANNYSKLCVHGSKLLRVKEGFVKLLQSAAHQLHSVRGDPASHIQLCFPPKRPIYISQTEYKLRSERAKRKYVCYILLLSLQAAPVAFSSQIFG